MLVKNDACSRRKILRIVNEPVVPGIAAHNGHNEGICKDNGEVLRIQNGKVIRIKHRPPSPPVPLHIPPASPSQTMREVPSSPSGSDH